MSYGYGGGGGRRGRRGGRGNRDGSRERWDRGGGGGRGSMRGHSSEYDHDRGTEGGLRDRPPPHLKGREIGLWYARYGAVRRKQADRRSRAVVQMDEAREQHITKLLDSVQNDHPRPDRDSRDVRATSSDNWHAASTSTGHWEKCSFHSDNDPCHQKHYTRTTAPAIRTVKKQDGEFKLLILHSRIEHGNIPTVCLHHEQVLLSKYSTLKQKCCDPCDLHPNRRRTKSLKVVSMDYCGRLINPPLTIVPSEKLCPTCYIKVNEIRFETVPLNEPSMTSSPSADPNKPSTPCSSDVNTNAEAMIRSGQNI